MLAGQLEIQLLANLARLADDMNKAKGLVGAAMKSVEGSVAGARRALGLLGVGISAASVIQFARNAVNSFVEAEQSVNRFNALLTSTGNVTGIAAAEMANLTQKISDITFIDDEKIRDSMSGMLVFKNVVGDTFTEVATLGAQMMTLGGEFEGAMGQLARALDSPMEASRSLRALKINLTDSEEALIKKYVESGNIQKAQNVILDRAKGLYKGLSDEMNKGIVGTVKDLKRSWGEMLESIGAAFAPSATSLFTWAKEGFDQIKDFMNDPSILKFLALAGGYYEKPGPAMAPINKNLEGIQESRRQLAEYEKQLDALKGKQGAAFEAAASAIHESIKIENARLVQLQGAIMAPSASDLAKKAAEDVRDANAKAEAAAAAAAEAQKKAVAAAKEYQNAVKSLLAELFPLAAAYDKFGTDVAMLNGLLAKGVIDQEEYNTGFDALIGKLPDVEEFNKKYEQGLKDIADSKERTVDAFNKQIQAMQDELDLLGPYNRANVIANKTQELLKTSIGLTADEALRLSTRYADALEKLSAGKEAIAAQEQIRDEMKRTADSIRDSLTDALLRGFENGKGFAENFRDTLINMFQTLVLRPTIQGILAPVSGALAGLAPGSANAAAGVGGMDLSSLFNLGSGIGSFAGSTLGLSGFPTGAGSISATGGLAGTNLLGAASAVPWLAIAAVAIPIISSLFDDGPADRTANFTTGYGGDPNARRVDTPFGRTGITDSHWFSGQEMGQALDAFILGIATTDKQIVEQLNLSTDQITAARLNLEDLNNKTYSFGTEHEGIEGLTEITKDRYSAIFKTVNEDLSLMIANYDQADEKIGEYISGAVQLYKALDNVSEAMPELSKSLLAFASLSGQQLMDAAAIINYAVADPVKDARTFIEAQSRTLYQTWNLQGDSLRKLISTYDGSASATRTLADLTKQRYQTEIELATQILQLLDSSSAMFSGSAEQIRLSVMSADQQYAYYDKKVRDNEALLRLATDPSDIEKYSRNINDYTLKAWGVLTPDQQKKLSDPFAKYLEGIGAEVDAKLNTSLGEISADHDTSLPDSIASAIETAMEKAAAKFLEAAQMQLLAAQTPLTVDSNVDVNVRGSVITATATTEVGR